MAQHEVSEVRSCGCLVDLSAHYPVAEPRIMDNDAGLSRGLLVTLSITPSLGDLHSPVPTGIHTGVPPAWPFKEQPSKAMQPQRVQGSS